MTQTHKAFIGLGSNLGERLRNLERAIALFPPQVRALRLSSVWQTTPWGYEQQPDFLNQVAQVETRLSALELLSHLKRIERVLGREPSFTYGPRLIDLDILLYDELVCSQPELTIPHPHLAERAFMLQPLKEIAPELVHPVLKVSIAELAGRISNEGVSLYDDAY